MKLKKHNHIELIALAMLLLCFNSCVESFEYESKDFEKLIIINAVITDEVKQQEVHITNTTPIDEHYVSPETNATVIVKDDSQNQYTFTEIEPGKYMSQSSFGALEGNKYSLHVQTSNGRKYYSKQVSLISNKKPVSIIPKRIVNDDGIIGVDLLANSYDETNNSKYYKYEYEESYKIIAPLWVLQDLVPNPNTPSGVTYHLYAKETEQETCYSTVNSNAIIQTNTINLTEDRVEDFSVRFIPITDMMIAHRYSILVKQYVQSRDAYAYYEKIKESIEVPGNLFSQAQAGFVQGNMLSETNINENVIGFFEVSTVVSDRIFFNFEDVFENDTPPKYDCPKIAPLIFEGIGDYPLVSFLTSGFKFLSLNDENPGDDEGPFILVPPACGDCTVLGNAEVPNFWIE